MSANQILRKVKKLVEEGKARFIKAADGMIESWELTEEGVRAECAHNIIHNTYKREAETKKMNDD